MTEEITQQPNYMYYDYDSSWLPPSPHDWSRLDVINLVMLCLMTPLAVVTNALSLVVMFKSRWIYNTHDGVTILASLAVADLLTGLGMPFMVWAFFWSKVESFHVIVIVENVTKVPVYVSFGLLVVLTVERYAAITYPLRHAAWFTRRRLVVTVALLWVGAVVRAAVVLSQGCVDICWPELNFTLGINSTLGFEESGYSEPFLQLVTDLVFYVLAVVLFACLYGKVLAVARAQHRRIEALSIGPTGHSKIKNKATSTLKANKTVACILAVFTLTWLPFMVARAVARVGTANGDVILSIYVISLSNACSNFFIYAWTNRPFKKAYREVVCFWKRRQQAADDSLDQ